VWYTVCNETRIKFSVKKTECKCDNVLLLFFLEPKKWNIFSAISLYFTKCSDWKTFYTHLKLVVFFHEIDSFIIHVT